QRQADRARRGGDGERQVRRAADRRDQPVGAARGAQVRELIRRVFRGVRGGEAGAARIRLVTSRYLGAKRFLTLVEVDGELLFLTFFVMLPTLREMQEKALAPWQRAEIADTEALGRAYDPLRRFMLRQTREKDLALFVGATGAARPQSPDDVPPQALLPAFLISELKTAFQMGFLIYVPFLILDMVVASVLTSMGMITLPPVLIS